MNLPFLKETKQKLLSPLTLQLAQLFLTIFRNHPLITKEQKETFRPFFIIGSGRSGTTLLRTILMRHPAIAIPPETYGLLNAIKKYIRYNGLDWQDLVNVVLGEFHAHPTFQYWETDLWPIRFELYDTPERDRSLARIIHSVYQCYLQKHKSTATIWGDKTPFNTLRLKWIKKVFPRARYLHLLRDGRDVVSSYLKAKLMSSVEAACHRWNTSLDAADRFEKSCGPGQIISLRYEDLVEKPAELTDKICRFLEIEYLPEMIENMTVKLGDEALEHLKNVQNPINKKSIGKWKKHLSPEEQMLTIKLLKDRLIKKGYRVD